MVPQTWDPGTIIQTAVGGLSPTLTPGSHLRIAACTTRLSCLMTQSLPCLSWDLDRKVDAEWYQPVDQLQSLELSA